MAKIQKPHLHFNQQRPFENPKEGEHASVVQEMFASKPPTSEDEYFFEQGQKFLRGAKLKHKEPLEKTGPQIEAEPEHVPVNRHGRFWKRIIRSLYQWRNTNWRP